jgi:hypothetical protein
MRRATKFTPLLLAGTAILWCLALEAQNNVTGPGEMPPARAIPGLTTEDQFPRGCVDCHVNYATRNMDERLSTLMKAWTEQVEPSVLEAAQAVAGSAVRLAGVHPMVETALRDIPGACLDCHRDGPGSAVPLVPLLHKLHLVGMGEAVYLRVFQGECTHCHKLDQSTGLWRVPSGPEETSPQ